MTKEVGEADRETCCSLSSDLVQVGEETGRFEEPQEGVVNLFSELSVNGGHVT